MSEAVFSTDDVVEVTPETVEELKRRAAESPRRQSRLCLHQRAEDRVHDMINAYCRGAYARPHRHPEGKSESYHIIEGEMTVYFFDDAGNVTRQLRMGPPGSGSTFIYRLSASIWHLPVAESEAVVYHETFCGPFNKDTDVEYAEWSPREEDRDAVEAFLQQLKKSES